MFLPRYSILAKGSLFTLLQLQVLLLLISQMSYIKKDHFLPFSDSSCVENATPPLLISVLFPTQLTNLTNIEGHALNRKSQLDILYSGTQFPKSHWSLSFGASKSQRFKSQRLQDANASKSQPLAFYKSQRFSATKLTSATSDSCSYESTKH